MGSLKKGAAIHVEKRNYHWHGQHGLRSSGIALLVCDAQLILILTPGDARNALLVSDAQFIQIHIPSNALADALLIPTSTLACLAWPASTHQLSN